MKAYHLTSAEYALAVISDQRLKLSLLDDLNDPFELCAVELSDDSSKKEAKKFKEYMAAHYGVLCFSKVWKNPLLWSHYAKRHKGVALEFEINNNNALSIRYRKERYHLNFGNYLKHGISPSIEDIRGIWLTKFKSWEYEEEIRVIASQKECINEKDTLFYPLNNDILLNGLIIGPLCEISLEAIKDKIPAGEKLVVTKSRLAFRSFNIVKFGNVTLLEGRKERTT